MAEEKNKIEGSTLYLVGTPIGNLWDLSERAKKTLSEVDFIACEDTRNTYKLLCAFGIRNETVSYHEHNKRESGERIVARLLSGESCALVTDAGMPAVSDPGEDIVRLCYEAGVKVTTVPGPTALITALALSGLSTAKFCFEGFLPAKAGDRKKRLEELKGEERTVIYYEAPHKLRATLLSMLEVFGGERRISLCRELTKLNEEITPTTLWAANEYYNTHEPRGEYALVVEGSAKQSHMENSLLTLTEEEHVSHYEKEGLRRMDAIKAAAKDRGISKSELYSRLNKD